MSKPNPFGIWAAQIRVNFLLLAVLLVLIGLAFAAKWAVANGTSVNAWDTVLVFLGVVLAHISVNLFNEYSDYHTRIDFDTIKTGFSGGTGMMTAGYTSPRAVITTAITTLAIASAIGLYFTFAAHWLILPTMAIGAFAVVFYTNFLAKHLLGEFFTGLTLGSLVVFGTVIALTANQQTPISLFFNSELILISIPPGILTFLLLFLNEFPDADADKKGGRFHLVIKLGKRNSAILYNVLLFLSFAVVAVTPIANAATWWIYISFLTLPLAVKAGAGAIKHCNDNEAIVPVLGQNVIIVLATDLLVSIGLFLG